MPTKSASRARSGPEGMDVLKLLKADHAEVSEMFKKYESGRLPKDRKAALVQKICAALTVHAQVEEEIFYPEAREAAKAASDLLNEAEVEHGSLKELMAMLEEGSPDDDLFDAQVKVLAEYVKHHVKEEEGELFPKVRKSGMDLKEVGSRVAARKKELKGELEAA